MTAADEAAQPAAGPTPAARRGGGRAVVSLAPVAALAVGLAAGFAASPRVPGWLAPYLPVLALTALDAVVGGARAAAERVFDDRVLAGSLLTNAAVAVGLVALGTRLGAAGALTTAVLVVLGIRVFTNATALRRALLGL